MLRLVIDNRELQIKQILNERKIDDIQVEYKQLLHGDLVIMTNEKVIGIFERKTIEDLTSSIKDTRYHNQKACLLEHYDINTIYYIIEGNMDFTANDSITGAYYSMLVRDNIKVILTRNINNTVDFITNFYKRISEKPEKYLDNCKKSKELVVKKGKENTFLNMLCQIPGVSPKIARGISCKYGLFSNFYDSLKVLDDDQKYKVILELNLLGTRAVPKNTIKNIIDEVFGIDKN